MVGFISPYWDDCVTDLYVTVKWWGHEFFCSNALLYTIVKKGLELKSGLSPSVFSPNAENYGPEKAPYLDTFHARSSSWYWAIVNVIISISVS